ncbi:protein OS-9-like [Dreissena polymorpha]|uniref:protein OS-9-like n=1 Tax=Dreissena polymorpha TaxID=45954 RepID=UPI00226463D3|nr:protein OS-9-like [Dreissena polymorpha]
MMRYGIDIKNEPVSMKEHVAAEDTSSVRLTSKYGQVYQCTFPNAVDQEKLKEEAEKVAMETGIPDLLKPMESSPCLRKTKDWWSYEFCYGKYIKQFHLAEDGRIEGEVVLLGYFESDYSYDGDSSQSESKASSLQRYHTQQYVNGTKCELNQKLRKTEVRFVCEEGTADYIHRLDEPETCSYIMTIHTMLICHHPFMKPPTPSQSVSITCNPLLSETQYRDYLQQLEAKEAAEKAEREKEAELQRQKAEAELDERRRLAGEKAKYFRENQIVDGTQDSTVEVEGSPDVETDVAGEINSGEEPDLSEQWNSILKASRDTGDDAMPESNSVFKVITSPEEFKEFFKEAMEQVKKLNTKEAKDAQISGKGDKEEENEEVKDRLRNIPPAVDKNDEHPGLKKMGEKEADSGLEDPELEELDQEINTLKEKYKTRKQKLTEYKQKVKSSMAQQYEAIIKEAQEELAQEGIETDLETQQNREAIRHLTKAIDGLLDKLDKTEQDINAVNKELEQFAEYDEAERDVKSIPPVRDDTPPTPPKQATLSEPTGPEVKVEGQTEEIKVKVSKIPKGQMTKAMASALGNKHTEALEQSVKQELEKAGFGNGDKIQVKIITTAYDSNDDTLHVLSDQESEAFRNMIVDMIGGTSEVDREQARHDQLEENYSFVWGSETNSAVVQPKDSGIGEGEGEAEKRIVLEPSTYSDAYADSTNSRAQAEESKETDLPKTV